MNSRFGRPIITLLVVLSGLLFLSSGLYGMTGVVYIDQNENLQYDEGDLPFAGAVVSDGFTVTVTDEHGVFTLTLNSDAKFVFLSTPNATKPLAGWYKSVSEKAFDFPLTRVIDKSPLVFVQLSDTHYATDPDEFKEAFYDRRMKVLPETVFDEIVPEVNDLDPDFVILTGDIVADSKRPDIVLVDKWMNYMGTEFAPRFSAPFYAIVGNHDVVRDEAVDKAIYERYFGPTYYSFNVKGVHFIVLDTQQLVGTSLVYTVTPTQLSWLEQDLAATDPGAPVVVFCHEPSPDWAETPVNKALLHLLSETGITALLDGHWHTNFLLQRYPFYELTSGAVCASWWEGEGPDGTEFGYRVYRIVRGTLDSIWRDAGLNSVEFHSPQRAVIQWTERLQAAVWGDAARASLSIDDAEAIERPVFYNSLWTTAYGN
ncbi:MAG: metallophosphoesterase, partial [Candidatus Bipolaricaulota bacterium]|nr:metallophosphoesterase [Candidatus Bipolaricaulota bacterium]